MIWSGTLYASGTLTANGNSGIVRVPSGSEAPTGSGFSKALLRFVPAGLATDETLDVVMAVAWDHEGLSVVTPFHTFTQVTNTNAVETVLLPDGESSGLLSTFGLIPPWWKFTWTLGGTTKSMSFTVYGSVEA